MPLETQDVIDIYREIVREEPKPGIAEQYAETCDDFSVLRRRLQAVAESRALLALSHPAR